MDKKKILHIDNSGSITGAYRALLSWCHEATDFDHIWILPSGSTVVHNIDNEFTIYTLPFVEIGKNAKKLLFYFPYLWKNSREIKKIIQKEKIDIIHINDLYNLAPYFARKSGRERLPIIVHARMLKKSFPARIYDFWKKWHLKNADGIIAVSQIVKENWDNDERVSVIYDPIALQEKLPPYIFSNNIKYPFRFLYLANYISGKGQDDAIKAIKILRNEGITNFTIDFYGGTMGLLKNDEYLKYLKEFAKDERLDQIISFNDVSENVEALMKQYNALLHFSHAESFGMVCYEALYYGLPVISTDCGGPAEMIQNRENGILVPLQDISLYAEYMKQFIHGDINLNKLSKNSKYYIRDKFVNNAFAKNNLSSIFDKFN